MLLNFFLLNLCCFLILCLTSSAKNDFLVDEITVDESKLLIVTISRLGLANRLRALADWYSVATLMKRTLVISWQPTIECNVAIEDLFEELPVNMKVLRVHLPPEDDGVKFVETTAKSYNISITAIYTNDEKTMLWGTSRFETFELNPAFFAITTDIIITSYDGILSPQNFPCQFYMSQHSYFLRSLVPTEEIRNAVNAIIQEHFSQYIFVGVHIRVHDANFDWAMVPPGAEGGLAKTFGDGATLQDFVSVMKRIEQSFTDGIHGQTRIRYFVASNSEDKKRDILKHFPTAISINGDVTRQSIEGIQRAFIEWLILSEATLILNTYGSSFAEEAAVRNLRPLISIWSGRVLHHHTIYLPFCGHIQFAKLMGQSTKIFEYTEGTVDMRKINGGLVTFSECDLLDEWGLYDAICPKRD